MPNGYNYTRGALPDRRKDKKEREKAHFFFFSVTLYVKVDDNVMPIPMNHMARAGTRNVTKRVLQQVNNATIGTAVNTRGIQVPDVLDLIVNNISYLGHMTEAEFDDIKSTADMQEDSPVQGTA